MVEVAAETSKSKPVVECLRLSKVFKDFWLRDRARAVDGVTFNVMPREIFGLLGPNGSGKSTTIKLLLGLLKPTSGRAVVFGNLPSDVRTKRRIGYLPEESYLYQFLNARETLDYYGKLFNLEYSVRQRRIDELLDMVGLAHAQYRPVREYSKGMQRRIGLAQALINDPDLLILDEPTTGLDPIGTRQVKDLILELGRRGKTIILSSHLLGDVEDVVSRMVILYGGRIRDEGTCEQLLTRKNLTTIETDELDDETISEIDSIIRKRSSGDKSVRRVTKPRQKLEELFLGIVERAQAEKASTSGAMHGGLTAGFLRADPVQEGEELIASLTREEPRVRDVDELLAESELPAEVPEAGSKDALIDELMMDQEDAMESEPEPAIPEAESLKQAEVDRSLIDSLLDADDSDEEPVR